MSKYTKGPAITDLEHLAHRILYCHLPIFFNGRVHAAAFVRNWPFCMLVCRCTSCQIFEALPASEPEEVHP